MSLLKFARGNAKLGKHIYSFSLPSGFTCPGAKECLSKADKITGKLTDGPDNKFRCFSATQENMFPATRKARWYNFDLLKKHMYMADLIRESIPKKAGYIRIHIAGDFFQQAYFDAWLDVAKTFPSIKFYFYTKSLLYWFARMPEVGNGYTPGTVPNFVPTASRGGRYDDMIKKYGLREAVVVYSEKEAADYGLEIDHDDTHAMSHGPDFALLLHGVQPAGSEASKALQKLKKTFSGYGTGKKSLKVV